MGWPLVVTGSVLTYQNGEVLVAQGDRTQRESSAYIVPSPLSPDR